MSDDNIDNNGDEPKIYFVAKNEDGDCSIEVDSIKTSITNIEIISAQVILKPVEDKDEKSNKIPIFSCEIGVWTPLSSQEWVDIYEVFFPKLYKRFKDKLN